MEVGVADLRAQLSTWLDRARNGEEVVVTDRGVPVVRLVGVHSSSRLEELLREGVIARPHTEARPRATGRSRPYARQSVAERVSADRR